MARLLVASCTCSTCAALCFPRTTHTHTHTHTLLCAPALLVAVPAPSFLLPIVVLLHNGPPHLTLCLHGIQHTAPFFRSVRTPTHSPTSPLSLRYPPHNTRDPACVALLPPTPTAHTTTVSAAVATNTIATTQVCEMSTSTKSVLCASWVSSVSACRYVRVWRVSVYSSQPDDIQSEFLHAGRVSNRIRSTYQSIYDSPVLPLPPTVTPYPPRSPVSSSPSSSTARGPLWYRAGGGHGTRPPQESTPSHEL